MFIDKKNRNRWADPLGLYGRSSLFQVFLDPGTAALLASGVAAGGEIGGALLAGGSSKPKKISTFSRRQKEIDRLIFDILMGVRRSGDGTELGRDPWLLDLMKRKKPLQQVAPFTSNQQQVMSAAMGQLPRVMNPRRPDQGMLSQLGRGITPYDKEFQSRVQPSMSYAVAGGTFGKKDSAVVGEAGWEIVTALPGGGFKVTPNPKTVSSKKNLTAALAQSKKVQKETGIPGLVAGGTVDPRRKFGDYYLPESFDWRGVTSWDPANDWTTSARTSAEEYMGQNYADQGWYKRLQGKYGGDIGTVDYRRPGGGAVGNKKTAIHAGYGDALQDWWGQWDVVTDRSEVSEAMAGIPADQQAAFSDWWKVSPYNDITNALGPMGGSYGFSDPWGVDIGNLNRAIPEFQSYYSSPGGPGYVTPEVDTAPPTDWDQYNWGWNKDTNMWSVNAPAGATNAPGGLQYNYATGTWEVPAFTDPYAASPFPGGSDTEQGAAGPGAGPGWSWQQPGEGEVGKGMWAPEGTSDLFNAAPEEDTTLADQDQEMFDAILASMTSYTSDFDPTNAQANFEASIADPARASFEESVRPSIRAAHAGDAFFGSGREKAETTSINRMEAALTGARGTYMQTAEEAHKTRGLAATNAMMNLAKLPGEMRAQTASTNHVNALTAGVFHDMEWTNSLADAALTNQTLTSLALIWPFVEAAQGQNQLELDAMMRNAITDEYGFNWEMIFSWIMGTPYQDQGQTAVVTGGGS